MSKSAPYMHTDTYQSVVGRYIADWHGVLWISLLLVISYGYPVNFMLEQGFCSRWEDFESLNLLIPFFSWTAFRYSDATVCSFLSFSRGDKPLRKNSKNTYRRAFNHLSHFPTARYTLKDVPLGLLASSNQQRRFAAILFLYCVLWDTL